MYIMVLIKGYKFNTEEEAIGARTACNAHYGIPKSPEDTTQNWVDYETANLNEPIFYYIKHDDSLEVVLGKPIEFEIVTPEPPVL